jgi:hypothetical protein
VLPLGVDFEPAAQVECKVVATKGAIENERKHGKQRSYRDEDEPAMVEHVVIA